MRADLKRCMVRHFARVASTKLRRAIVAILATLGLIAASGCQLLIFPPTPSATYTWGLNTAGQLGNGNDTGPDTCLSNPCSTTPLNVGSLTSVVAVSAGDEHSLALLSNGTVMAWGDNLFGQLGDGTTTGSTTPVPVPGLSNVTAIAAGYDYSLALLSNGTVMAWGDNTLGQLGDGSASGPQTCTGQATPCSTTPVVVSDLTGVKAMAAGNATGQALLSNGTVATWGLDSEGELGISPLAADCWIGQQCSRTPVAISGLSNVVSVVSSSLANYSFALLRNGIVMAWGLNYWGQLGNGNDTGPDSCPGDPCSEIPIAISGLTNVQAIATGLYNSMALTRAGTVMTWGMNAAGELGNGSSSGPDMCPAGGPRFACSATPVVVTGLRGVVGISAGSGTDFAILGNGAVMAWGDNSLGQLGIGTISGPDNCTEAEDGSPSCSTIPIAVSGLAGATAISGGWYFELART